MDKCHACFVSVHVKINGLLTFFFYLKWYKLKVFLLFVISLSEIKCALTHTLLEEINVVSD